MSGQIVGLWLGGAISIEAARMVERAVRGEVDTLHRDGGPRTAKVCSELYDLANAIRAQIQQVTEPMDPNADLI